MTSRHLIAFGHVSIKEALYESGDRSRCGLRIGAATVIFARGRARGGTFPAVRLASITSGGA
tara:strand:- start:5 stop:190 length:186 start_codon:yes stop_codon:yes gene_type:complete